VNGQTFQICIGGASYPTTPSCKTFTYPTGLAQTWSNLIPGAYTVTNPTRPPCGLSSSPCRPPRPPTLHRRRHGREHAKTGSLEVTKSVNWNGIAPESDGFEILHQRPLLPYRAGLQEHHGRRRRGRGETDLERPGPGSYTVTETAQAEWDYRRDRLAGGRARGRRQATASVGNTRKARRIADH